MCHQDWCDGVSVSSIRDAVPQVYTVWCPPPFVWRGGDGQMVEERFPKLHAYHIISYVLRSVFVSAVPVLVYVFVSVSVSVSVQIILLPCHSIHL